MLDIYLVGNEIHQIKVVQKNPTTAALDPLIQLKAKIISKIGGEEGLINSAKKKVLSCQSHRY